MKPSCKCGVLTIDTGFRRFSAQRFVPRQCRQDFGGAAGQEWCDGEAEAWEDAAVEDGSGKTEFLFRIGPRHKRFGGLALTRPLLAVGGAKIPIHVAPTEVRQEKLGCSEGESPSRLMEESVFGTKEKNGKV